MCLICIDFQRQRLTLTEAKRAFSEMAEGLGDHREAVRAMLDEAERAQAEAPKPPSQPAINTSGVATKP
jgi:hypothetical protein